MKDFVLENLQKNKNDTSFLNELSDADLTFLFYGILEIVNDSNARAKYSFADINFVDNLKMQFANVEGGIYDFLECLSLTLDERKIDNHKTFIIHGAKKLLNMSVSKQSIFYTKFFKDYNKNMKILDMSKDMIGDDYDKIIQTINDYYLKTKKLQYCNSILKNEIDTDVERRAIKHHLMLDKNFLNNIEVQLGGPDKLEEYKHKLGITDTSKNWTDYTKEIYKAIVDANYDLDKIDIDICDTIIFALENDVTFWKTLSSMDAKNSKNHLPNPKLENIRFNLSDMDDYEYFFFIASGNLLKNDCNLDKLNDEDKTILKIDLLIKDEVNRNDNWKENTYEISLKKALNKKYGDDSTKVFEKLKKDLGIASINMATEIEVYDEVTGEKVFISNEEANLLNKYNEIKQNMPKLINVAVIGYPEYKYVEKYRNSDFVLASNDIANKIQKEIESIKILVDFLHTRNDVITSPEDTANIIYDKSSDSFNINIGKKCYIIKGPDYSFDNVSATLGQSLPKKNILRIKNQDLLKEYNLLKMDFVDASVVAIKNEYGKYADGSSKEEMIKIINRHDKISRRLNAYSTGENRSLVRFANNENYAYVIEKMNQRHKIILGENEPVKKSKKIPLLKIGRKHKKDDLGIQKTNIVKF